MTPTLSCYISAFNLIQNGFDYETALRRALAFFDEVVVAVNTSTDSTFVALQSFADQIEHVGKLKVVQTDIPYTDITFDGRVKDAALQACTGDVMVQMDLDEFVPLAQRDLWRRIAAQLLAAPVDCFMIPTVDLWGSMDTVRADAPIGLKFRMHKRGLHRGVWKQAWRNGRTTFDTSMSDSCELLTAQDDLARAVAVVPQGALHPACTQSLNGYPFTVHTGYVSFDQRIKVNKAIWAHHWELRSGHRENVAVDKRVLEDHPLIKHSLNLS